MLDEADQIKLRKSFSDNLLPCSRGLADIKALSRIQMKLLFECTLRLENAGQLQILRDQVRHSFADARLCSPANRSVAFLT
jgi:hypothetical protein